MFGIEIVASEEDIRHFYITFDGPRGTLYEGGKYNLEMYVPPDYPNIPPKCLFMTPIYHVNVNDLGKYTRYPQATLLMTENYRCGQVKSA